MEGTRLTDAILDSVVAVVKSEHWPDGKLGSLRLLSNSAPHVISALDGNVFWVKSIVPLMQKRQFLQAV